MSTATGVGTERSGSRRSRSAAVVAACVVIAVGAASAAGQSPRRKADTSRSRPPGGQWDRVTEETFLPDAFSTLPGPRPDFGLPDRGPEPAPTTAGTVTWSTLVSADTLVGEIKAAKAALTAACDRATDFKGGGFEKARVSFGSLALAFGVIAAYDHDVRWKKSAATARDLFARAGFNCRGGTDQSFAESKARLEDLGLLLADGAPKGRPDRTGEFRWSQVAARPALMSRLEAAQDVMRPAIASRADFGGQLEDLRRAVEIVAAIGEVIQQPDFEDHADDAYRGHAAAMRDAAVEARAACERKDYDAARAAVGRIERSCDDCHGDYRG